MIINLTSNYILYLSSRIKSDVIVAVLQLNSLLSQWKTNLYDKDILLNIYNFPGTVPLTQKQDYHKCLLLEFISCVNIYCYLYGRHDMNVVLLLYT